MQKLLCTLIISTFLFACNEEAMQNSETAKEEINTAMIEKQLQEHTATVSVTVPDSRWSISIQKVIQTKDYIAVVSQLKQSDMMGMMVISERADAVKFKAEALPIKYYVLGKTWNWENSEPYNFVNSISNIKGVDIPFQKIPPSKPRGPKRNEM